MTLPDLPSACPMCETPVEAAAKFCSACGAPLGSSGPGPATPKPRWYYNVWFVLLMLFFVVGPFGLPLVWKNPRFSRTIKWLLTVLMVGYTIGGAILVARMVEAVTASVNAFNATLPF